MRTCSDFAHWLQEKSRRKLLQGLWPHSPYLAIPRESKSTKTNGSSRKPHSGLAQVPSGFTDFSSHYPRLHKKWKFEYSRERSARHGARVPKLLLRKSSPALMRNEVRSCTNAHRRAHVGTSSFALRYSIASAGIYAKSKVLGAAFPKQLCSRAVFEIASDRFSLNPQWFFSFSRAIESMYFEKRTEQTAVRWRKKAEIELNKGESVSESSGRKTQEGLPGFKIRF